MHAEAIAVNPDTGTFFVASYGETVSAYSGATDTVTGMVDLGEPTNSLAVNPGTGRDQQHEHRDNRHDSAFRELR